jgi:hypothetical protein
MYPVGIVDYIAGSIRKALKESHWKEMTELKKKKLLVIVTDNDAVVVRVKQWCIFDNLNQVTTFAITKVCLSFSSVGGVSCSRPMSPK